MSYLGVGVSPGTVPVYHSTNIKVLDRRVKVAELVLRCVICGLGVLAAFLVGTDTEVKEIFTIQKKAKFTDIESFSVPGNSQWLSCYLLIDPNVVLCCEHVQRKCALQQALSLGYFLW